MKGKKREGKGRKGKGREGKGAKSTDPRARSGRGVFNVNEEGPEREGEHSPVSTLTAVESHQNAPHITVKVQTVAFHEFHLVGKPRRLVKIKGVDKAGKQAKVKGHEQSKARDTDGNHIKGTGR